MSIGAVRSSPFSAFFSPGAKFLKSVSHVAFANFLLDARAMSGVVASFLSEDRLLPCFKDLRPSEAPACRGFTQGWAAAVASYLAQPAAGATSPCPEISETWHTDPPMEHTL